MNYHFVIFREFDEGKVVLSKDSPFTFEELENFYLKNYKPVLRFMNEKVAEEIFTEK